MMRVFSIIVIIFLLLILVFLSVYLLIMRIFFQRALGRKNTIKRLEEKSELIDLFKIDLCFWEKNKFEELTMISEDGLKLKAHFLRREQSNKTAIVVHGYAADYREMSNYSRMFVEMGYNVLVLENRAHGKSEGTMIGMGYYDKYDILSWIEIVKNKIENSKIVLFGLSMGASAVCMTLGEQLPKNVVCAISDCAFDNVYNQIKHVFNPKNKKTKNKLLSMFNSYMKRAYSFDLKNADASICLKKNNLPVLFIHGKEDSYVPVDNVYRLTANLSDFKKDVYLAEQSGHAMSYVTNPRRYEIRVREFLKKWGM